MSNLNDIYTLYKTNTCTRCKLAIGSMTRAGAVFREVYLDTPEGADDLRRVRAAIGSDYIQVPIVERPDGKLLTNLADISTEFRAKRAV